MHTLAEIQAMTREEVDHALWAAEITLDETAYLLWSMHVDLERLMAVLVEANVTAILQSPVVVALQAHLTHADECPTCQESRRQFAEYKERAR